MVSLRVWFIENNWHVPSRMPLRQIYSGIDGCRFRRFVLVNSMHLIAIQIPHTHTHTHAFWEIIVCMSVSHTLETLESHAGDRVLCTCTISIPLHASAASTDTFRHKSHIHYPHIERWPATELFRHCWIACQWMCSISTIAYACVHSVGLYRCGTPFSARLNKRRTFSSIHTRTQRLCSPFWWLLHMCDCWMDAAEKAEARKSQMHTDWCSRMDRIRLCILVYVCMYSTPRFHADFRKACMDLQLWLHVAECTVRCTVHQTHSKYTYTRILEPAYIHTPTDSSIHIYLYRFLPCSYARSHIRTHDYRRTH